MQQHTPQVVIYNMADPAAFKELSDKLDLAIARQIRTHTLMETLMAKFSEYAASQKAFNDAQAAGIDAVNAAVDGVAADVQVLNDKITALQNSQGDVTPEDQALIDELQSAGQSLKDKMDALSAKATALDAQNPPTVPTSPT